MVARGPGGDNNPYGCKGKPEINDDNVNSDSEKEADERPTGNSRAAALRRLRKHRPDLHEQVIDDNVNNSRRAAEFANAVDAVAFMVDAGNASVL